MHRGLLRNGLLLAAACGLFCGCQSKLPPADVVPQTTSEAAPSTGSSPIDASPVDASGQLTAAILDESLDLGRKYMLANQTEAGNFVYQMDLRTGEMTGEDSDVRQAGALWGLTLIHQADPRPDTRAAVERGIEFFKSNSKLTPNGGRYIHYPKYIDGNSGTVGLFTLALIDFIRAEPEHPQREELSKLLAECLMFLQSLERPDGLYFQYYHLSDGSAWGGSSPYFNGEILLALAKAARHLGRDDLQQDVIASAEAMHVKHVLNALESDPDSRETKGFYQWGSMAFRELHESGWEGTEPFGKRTIDMAHWMIDVHKTLKRRKNTGYAHEGIISAYTIARRLGDETAAEKFQRTASQALTKLTSWQVRGPLENEFLKSQQQIVPQSVGGIMNAANDPVLRIDVAQHQLHAVVLARQYLLKEVK